MTEAVKPLHPDAQKVIVHTVGRDELERYFRGELVRCGSLQRPTEPEWQLVGTFQQENGDNPAFGGKMYTYAVIWGEIKCGQYFESAAPR